MVILLACKNIAHNMHTKLINSNIIIASSSSPLYNVYPSVYEKVHVQ